MSKNKTNFDQSSAIVPTATTLLLSIIVCSVGAIFYLYEFILQVSPGVMTHELMHDLQLNAISLGLLSSCYYYAYASMQMPAGFLYDKFGPKKVLSTAILVCAFGAILFGATDYIAIVAIGRLLMGVGSAFAFIGALVLISRWFVPRLFALLAGITQTLSSVGAIIGGAPLAILVSEHGWRTTIYEIGMIGIVLAVLAWLIVRDSPDDNEIITAPTTQQVTLKQSLKMVCHNKQSWYTAIFGFCSWAPITVFAALWGVPYLMRNFAMDKTTASFAVSMVWAGIGIASPLLGYISDKMASRCKPLAWSMLVGVISTTLLLLVPNLPTWTIWLLLFGFGCASGAQALSFGVVNDNNHPSVVGTAVGLNNMAVVVGGALFQPLVGMILHANWSGKMVNGIHYYSGNDYRNALLIVPVCYLVGYIIVKFFIKETNCIAKYE